MLKNFIIRTPCRASVQRIPPPKGRTLTGQIVCYLTRPYRVLPTALSGAGCLPGISVLTYRSIFPERHIEAVMLRRRSFLRAVLVALAAAALPAAAASADDV